jgi:hypothetical protein
MSSFYQAEEARLLAIEELASHPSLKPSHKICLARVHRIDEWIEPSFRALVSTSYTDLKEEDFAYMGYLTTNVTLDTQYRVQTHRVSCALYPPIPRHSISCLDLQQCTNCWMKAWWGGSLAGSRGVAYLLLLGHSKLPASSILNHLEGMRVLGMGEECRLQTVQWIQSQGQSAGLLVEEKIISEGVKKLLDMQAAML